MSKIILGCGVNEAEIGLTGAEILSWRVAGRDLLWNGDAKFWPRRAPLLFPLCGSSSGGVVRVGGVAHPAPGHGFAPNARFDGARTGPASARLTLRDTDDTRAMYPFAFRLAVDIALDARGIDYDITIDNPGAAPLPYSVGLHPGFLWPFSGGDKAQYSIVFDQPERPFASIIAPGALFAEGQAPAPVEGRRLDLSRAFIGRDSLVMLGAASRSLSFVAPDGAEIRMETAGFPNWVFWTLPGAGYLCIEPWAGQGDPVGFAGDLGDRPGIILMPPGGRGVHHVRMAFSPALA